MKLQNRAIKIAAIFACASGMANATGANQTPNDNEIFESPPFIARTQPASNNVVDLSIVDRATGRALKKYYHRGQIFVAGTPGSKYAVRINNMAPGRLLTVVSVDGINVVNGKKASVNDVGYVLSAYEKSDINGWRKTDNEVAAFEFTALSNSYAAKTGQADNVGIIGVAAFTEKQRPDPRMYENSAFGSSSDRASAGPSAPAARQKSAESLGTGHGEREQSHVDRTTFERSSTAPIKTMTIRYDSYENLVVAGIIANQRPTPVYPQAFPGSNGYVPDPR